MALNLKKKTDRFGDRDDDYEAERAQKDQAFRSKITIQQFMNHNGPLFTAFARAGIPINEVVEGEVLREPARQAMRLATLIASCVSGTPPQEITAAMAAPYRNTAASYVAERWLGEMQIDIEKSAAEIASAVSLADGSWDHDPYRDERISDNASLMITAVNAAASLARVVETYDFRGGRGNVLGRLVNAVASAAGRTSRDMLGERASESDVRNVTQTAARNLSAILEACYERKAREVVAYLKHLPEEDKVEYYASNDPVSDILERFREWTLCFGGYAVAASRDMSQKPQTKLPGVTPSE